ncbi:MAG TPA: transglycosylase domain-containing protein [Burkholderiaceae bacterium]
MSFFRTLKFKFLLVFLILAAIAAAIVLSEMRTSHFQAGYFSKLAAKLNYKMGEGPSKAIRFPKTGPYDERLGYSRLPEFTKLLTDQNFVITDQARMSPELLALPLPPIYQEKDRAGIDLYDDKHQLLYTARSPERVYADFDSVPKLLADTLLFIEDRELLDTAHPHRNPAVNWSRLDRAVFDQGMHAINPAHEAPGASTLVTQIEKYRHSPEGRTTSAKEKLQQMESASIRAYLHGEDTMAVRRQTVVSYLNTVPLTAKAGYGEINGIGDGMWAWYGRDFNDVNALFRNIKFEQQGADLPQLALAYKQALSLMIAQRRPSYFLREGAPALMQMTNNHLRLLAQAGVISPALEKAALPLKLELNQGALPEPANSFVTRKAANALRTDLSSLLHMAHLYDLDRVDMSADTTLDASTQQAVTQVLRDLRKPEIARKNELYGHNMLAPGDNPGRLTFSFTLFERRGGANLLRVQTDNLDQPFDINSGARLNLGSTAKLRTLVTYLEVITSLHNFYGDMNPEDLAKVRIDHEDVLSKWAVDYFIANPHSNLADTLEAAMMRTYSGNPAEVFFTGGGEQQFENFEPEENYKIMSVREGFQHSVNLVFVRLMRDIVRYYEYKTPSANIQQLAAAASAPSDTKAKDGKGGDDEEPGAVRRRAALSRFADKEGKEFLARFYKKYAGKSSEEAEQLLIDSVHARPKRLAVIYRSLEPQADLQHFAAFMHAQFPEAQLNETTLQTLYDKFGVDQYSLNDRGYLAGVHPLELWLVGYLRQHPNATFSQCADASRDERQQVYEWLFKTHNKHTQEIRIRQLLELEAFQEIGAAWRRLGYPFGSLTPSIASALGASGDRPSSLAELMGIIVNHGMLMPTTKIESMEFAKGTPYETHFRNVPPEGKRMLPVELADIVRRSLTDVVQGGTGVRLKNGFVQKDGSAIEVGGKTGTGDQRYETYAPGGKLIESRAVNRSATFVFLIGDRYFGTITAYVHEPYAADYTFTSALTVQLLKSLIPALQPLVAEGEQNAKDEAKTIVTAQADAPKAVAAEAGGKGAAPAH